jgi:hypothetical protein
MVVLLSCPRVTGAESVLPRLYEYNPRFLEEEFASKSGIIELDVFTVFGKRFSSSSSLERALERDLRKGISGTKQSRFEIVPDDGDSIFTVPDGMRIVPIRSPGSNIDLKIMDVFFIDLPGGGVLKAQFKSGLSMHLNKHTKIILRPSRKKLISIRVDW